MNRSDASPALPAMSVLLCTHNPRRDYWSRVMDGLREQTLSPSEWELLVVDNASEEPLDGRVDLDWHPRARVIREERVGLTPARLRGVRESTGQGLVFVDDDNVLRRDYLDVARELFRAKPFLGTFGGSIEPEFETPPPAGSEAHWELIAIRPCRRSTWSNDREHWAACPCGAGLCVRRDVALHYAERAASDALRAGLDRQGASLVSGGDIDLVFTGLSMGYGMGRFAELSLTHLIPARRLEPDYLLRMYEAQGFSGVLVNALWGREPSDDPSAGVPRLARLGLAALRRETAMRKYRAAQRRGMQRARALLLNDDRPPRP